jgi:hypothetical protein
LFFFSFSLLKTLPVRLFSGLTTCLQLCDRLFNIGKFLFELAFFRLCFLYLKVRLCLGSFNAISKTLAALLLLRGS